MPADVRGTSPGDPFPGRRGWWRPLPECPGCGRPVQRKAFDDNGGACSSCRELAANIAPDPDRVDLWQWQLLAAERGRREREQQRQIRRHRRARL
jgi:recombinational DNA repair protein (RecF pathway)